MSKHSILTCSRSAIVSTLGVAALMLPPLTARAYVGTFDPYKVDFDGPQLITFIDSQSAPLRCVGLAAQTENALMAVAGLLAPITACSAHNSDNSECIVIAPISPGVGQAVAMVTALATPDALLGHEFRHCRDHEFHPTLLPFVEMRQ